jgi:hypothetical protein
MAINWKTLVNGYTSTMLELNENDSKWESVHQIPTAMFNNIQKEIEDFFYLKENYFTCLTFIGRYGEEKFGHYFYCERNGVGVGFYDIRECYGESLSSSMDQIKEKDFMFYENIY